MLELTVEERQEQPLVTKLENSLSNFLSVSSAVFKEKFVRPPKNFAEGLYEVSEKRTMNPAVIFSKGFNLFKAKT